jgi:hypothetical protein
MAQRNAISVGNHNVYLNAVFTMLAPIPGASRSGEPGTHMLNALKIGAYGSRTECCASIREWVAP